MYRSINPSTEEVMGEFPEHSPEQIESALRRSQAAFLDWRELSLEKRGEYLRHLAQVLENGTNEFARLITLEMGKPLKDAVLEVQKCAWCCRYFADQAEGYLRPEVIDLEKDRVTLLAQPMGPLFAIMPWNYPFWQVFRFAAPAIMAGNVVMLKHAPNVPQCARAIEQTFLRAGLPEGVLQSVFVDNEDAAQIIADRRIRGVTLTGSARAGRAVAEAAGQALKPVVLELGGSDPFLVLADADLEKVVESAIQAKNVNNGQVCISAKRFVIAERIYEDFVERFVAAMESRRVGDPLLETTDNGPLARADLKKTLQEQVDRSVRAGARIVSEAKTPPKHGYFFPPTVLESVPPGSPAYDEELFGPVASVFPYSDENEAIRLANDTPYGLGASIWTRDPERAALLAPKIEAGQISINSIVRTDPRVPFGGVKDSGFGKELGREGIRQFTNLKSVVMPK